DERRVVMIDLHPAEARAAGITGVSLIPQQPIPGITSEAVIDLAGRAGDSRPLALSVRTPDGQSLRDLPPAMVRFDAAGRAQHRVPLELPAQRWLKLVGTLQNGDPPPWENARARRVVVRPRHVAAVLPAPQDELAAVRAVDLAADPREGREANWR